VAVEMIQTDSSISWFRRHRGLLVFLVLGISTGLFSIVVLGTAGYWLTVEDEISSSDGIVILAGSIYDRALYASDLYQRKLAPIIYVSKPARANVLTILEKYNIHYPTIEEVNRKVLKAHGVPEQSIRIIGENSISTFEEAGVLKEIFGDRNLRIIVVTSPFHVRRARMILSRALTECDVRVVGSPHSPFKKKWWTDQDSARMVVLEVSKILFYICGGRYFSSEDSRDL
jgi:uncharacterized SAM-binding protein YcdF (DUF218 family)